MGGLGNCSEGGPQAEETTTAQQQREESTNSYEDEELGENSGQEESSEDSGDKEEAGENAGDKEEADENAGNEEVSEERIVWTVNCKDYELELITDKVVSKSLSPSNNTCLHSVVLRGWCVSCGKNMKEGFGVGSDLVLGGFRFSNPEICQSKELNSLNLFSQRKLQLVLDLDHTLLHSQRIHKLTHEEKYLKRRADSLENTSDGDLFKIDDKFIVKLRPYLRTFLKEASSMFELYIYTMGYRYYAEGVAMLLDPKCEYFIKSRIISRDDSKQKGKKSLDLVLGQERGIVILDDTESAWSEHKENLIVMGRYNYYRDQRFDHKSFSVMRTDENETNGALANDVGADAAIVWSRAEEMGATCKTRIDSSVTHLVSSNNKIEDYEWAELEIKYLVHPRWIYAAYYLWHKQPEYLYLPV
ncbi:RNA polymerase II C-terminal domain phosphatase-like 4 [Pistacia vera]|uniref:RNA polymerase II C-terminal domain phosphatase-like 4 n=1 Tax=Pistacia vera TaxID=55513 RepID=UPI001262E8E8|nr:RNA polymerase II C-terminal domain phosphatase-like 4 [Pistacia vera]